ncbi:DUF3822 family protein [Hanstruepera marina]|uniref:DUF3822 family protein n=1 Tax=Hanstruepera marina TaxID=2873265 RepID=UPI001CA7259E|nr:DUF3822 family protein [Hanstruepera marina]
MAIANNKLNKTTNNSLSIQISLNGLSFCVLNLTNKTITYLNHIKFDKRVTPFRLLDILKDQFLVEETLQQNFQSIQVVHVNELATIVPKALFNENQIADYLKFNSKILKSDFITYDTIEANNSVSVYVPYVNINNYIYEKFGSFTYNHVSSILIDQILQSERQSNSTKVVLNIYECYFQIIVVDKGALKLYNSFEFQTKEDFIYYVLFTFEQLQLDPETINLILLGDIEKDDELYAILYKYIRHVEFGKHTSSYNFSTAPKNQYSDFSLIHSF